MQFKTFDADEIKEYGCLMSKKYVRNEYTTDVQLTFLYGRQDFFYVLYLLTSASAVRTGLISDVALRFMSPTQHCHVSKSERSFST